MTTAEIVPYAPPPAAEAGFTPPERKSSIELAPEAWHLAHRIASTDFVPQALRDKPEQVLACILTGHELGIGALQALSKVHVIKGRPTLSAELMRALILQHGHEFWIVESTRTRCRVGGRRRDSQREQFVEFTMDDAKDAGLAGSETYRKHPVDMLLARASSKLARAVFPDVLAGISYTPEEVASGNFAEETWGDAALGDLTDGTVNVETDPQRAPAPAKPKAKARKAATRKRTEPKPSVEPPARDDAGELDEILDDDADLTGTSSSDDDEVVEGEVVPFPDNPDSDPPANTDGPRMTGPQTVAMRFAERGITDRAERLAACALIIGHEIESGKDLTPEETTEVLEVLADETDFAELRLSLDGNGPPATGADMATAPTVEEWKAHAAAHGLKLPAVLRKARELAPGNPPAAMADLGAGDLELELWAWIDGHEAKT